MRLPLLIRLRRVGYRGAYVGLRIWWFVGRPHTHGVKLLVHDDHGRVLFVRHTYGDRSSWELPGGGIRRREAPLAAARREAHEELGAELSAWRDLGSTEISGLGKTTTLHCFEASAAGLTLIPDLGELKELRWAPLTSPPAPLGEDAPAVLRLLVERVNGI